MTMVIVRLESLLSWMCTPDVDVVVGVNRNVSKPSKTERNACSFPPSMKCGFILSKNFLNAFKGICDLMCYYLFKFFTEIFKPFCHDFL